MYTPIPYTKSRKGAGNFLFQWIFVGYHDYIDYIQCQYLKRIQNLKEKVHFFAFAWSLLKAGGTSVPVLLTNCKLPDIVACDGSFGSSVLQYSEDNLAFCVKGAVSPGSRVCNPQERDWAHRCEPATGIVSRIAVLKREVACT